MTDSQRVSSMMESVSYDTLIIERGAITPEFLTYSSKKLEECWELIERSTVLLSWFKN